ADQQENSVGQSYASYNFEGKQWALPIDAATPVAASRPDLLKVLGAELPRTFEDLLALAKKGRVGFSLLPIDVLMSFYMFCCSSKEETCQNDEEIVSEETGVFVLKLFKSLEDNIDKRIYEKNPFKVIKNLTQQDEIAYSPIDYWYSN